MKNLTEEQTDRLENIIKDFIRYYDTVLDQENGQEEVIPAGRIFKEFTDYHEWVVSDDKRDCTVHWNSCICGGRYSEMDRICDNCSANRCYIENMLSK